MKILYYFFLLLLPCSLWAHNGIIKGRVLSEKTRLPLASSTVQILENQLTTSSDAFGNFAFQEIAAGKYTLTVTLLGYQKWSQTIEVLDNQPTEIVSLLALSELELTEITLTDSDQQGVNLVNAVDIKLRNTHNAQNLLRVVPGLFIAQHAGGGKAEQIFLRGFDIDHGTDINLQVDGMPVNMPSHAHGQGYADLHFVIPELVQSVAFEKGTYYANKGNFTTAGYVDFTTAHALDKSLLKIEGGQFGTARLVALLDIGGRAAKEKGQYAYIAGEFLQTQGYFDASQNFKRANLWGRYQKNLEDNSQISVSFAHFKSSWDASGQIPDRAVQNGLIGHFGAIDNTEGGSTSRQHLNIQHKKLLGNGALFTQQLYGIQYNFELYSNFTFFLQNPLYGDQIKQKEQRNILGYQASYLQEQTVGKFARTTEAGGGLRYDMSQDVELSRTFGRKKTLEALALGDVQELNSFAYWQESWQLLPQVTVRGAIRWDYFQFGYVNKLDSAYQNRTHGQHIFSPKLQIQYDPSPRLRLYAKAGYGFHSNDTRVSVLRGREALPKALGADLGLIFKPSPRLILQTAVWNLQLEQEFVYVGDEAIVEPSGRTSRQGIDFSARYQFMRWLFVDFDVNFTAPRALDVPKEENKIPLAPTLTSIGGLTFRAPKGLQGTLRYRYMGNRSANADYSLTAQGYFLLDASLQWDIRRYQVSLSAENVLDTRWREAQFETESRLKDENEPVSEIHYTPGTPFFLKVGISYSL